MKRKLTDTKVKNAKPNTNGTPKKYTDGGGMYLLVSKTSKCWRYNYRFADKQKTLPMGVYPDVKLKQARLLHEDARERLSQGIDPMLYKKMQQTELEDQHKNSFEVVAREWFVKFSPKWSDTHKAKVERMLEYDSIPYIGKRPIHDIKPPEVLKVCERVAERGAIYSAHKVKQVCGQVFRYGVASGRVESDPTRDLAGALPPMPKTQSFATIKDPVAVGELLRSIHGYSGDYVTVCALKLLPLVFTRPGELRAAEWCEFDFDKAIWTIPAEKMKKRRIHHVPLSPQAIAILRDIEPLTGRWKYVFPSIRSKQRPMSENTLNAALRRLGYDKTMMTSHGFRAMASSLLNEMNYNPDAIEAQLSHVDTDDVRSAYNRSDYWQQRVKMMNEWSDYLDSLRDGTANVIPFQQANIVRG